jgi:hypothetical protein
MAIQEMLGLTALGVLSAACVSGDPAQALKDAEATSVWLSGFRDGATRPSIPSATSGFRR